ncbi:T9SS type A sorting domain-containing protein [bacterium]|nr:T9SS type A sorting domain-containing protein [bacterium]
MTPKDTQAIDSAVAGACASGIITAILVAIFIGTLVVPAGAAIRDRIPPLLDDIATSAPVAFTDIVIQTDIADSLPPVAPGNASLFYSTDAQATWANLPLAAVAGNPNTWEALCPMPDGELLYYFLAHSDSAATFTGPKNHADAFPPPANVMVDPADEPLGDAVETFTDACDLTGARFGYSDDYCYASLSNALGSWPTNGGFFGPWFVYSAIISNPDAPIDSIGFAMVYADVPLLVQTGLYWADARDTSFVRIGDIDVTIVDGELHMRCLTADLIAHPDFGPDNPSGYYGVGAGTATSLITTVRWENDRTNSYAFYQRSDGVAPGTNTAPELSNAGAAPAGGGFADTLIRFSVTYADADGHLATVRNVVIDGNPHAMDCPGPDRDYESGVAFELDVALAAGDHEYCFSFGDGDLAVETVPAVATSGTDVPSDTPTAVLALRALWPQPCSSALHLSLTVGEHALGHASIYSTSGRLIRRLWSGESGDHETSWNMRDDAGNRVASGVYFVVLSDGRTSVQRKVVVLR